MRDVEAVLEAFAAERLLTLAANSVQISHEVLLTAWPLLRDTWLTESADDRIVRTRLHNIAAEWTGHSRDPSYLYSGTLLQAAAETAARIGANPARNPPLSSTEREFLHASGRAYRRTIRRRQAVLAGLLALTVAAFTAAGFAVHYAANANRQHAMALSRQLATESLSIAPTAPLTARQLAVAAWRVFPTAQADSVMTTLLGEQQQNGVLYADPVAVNGVAFSPDGKLLASADNDGTVRLWNPATGQAVGAPLHATSNVTSAKGGVEEVAFSSNGKLLASADADGMTRLWNPLTGRPVGHPLPTFTAIGQGRDSSGALAFSPHSNLLAHGDGEGTVGLWSPRTGRRIGTPLHAASAAYVVYRVAFSPNGKLLASASADGTVRLWDPLTGGPAASPLHVTRARGGVSGGLAFSHDSKLLATADADGMVRLWNPVTGRPAGTPFHVPGGVADVAFSPNSTLLASASAHGTVQSWDPLTGRPVSPPMHATSANVGVSGVAFSSNGKLLASADNDGTVRLWNPLTGLAAGPPVLSAPPSVSVVAFVRDGSLLASADNDGTAQLWNPVTGQPAGALIQPPGTPYSLGFGPLFWAAFSPNGKLLASADHDAVRLWDPVTGQPVGTRHPRWSQPPRSGVQSRWQATGHR